MNRSQKRMARRAWGRCLPRAPVDRILETVWDTAVEIFGREPNEGELELPSLAADLALVLEMRPSPS